MEKIYQNVKDVHAVVSKVYVKTDGFAYADKACKTKILAADLHDAFVKGMLIVDASGNEYKPVSCAIASDVATVTYVTAADSTTAKLATAKSVKEL